MSRSDLWPRLSALVAERLGLHYPAERWDDLQRGFAGAAHDLGFSDAAACTAWFMSAQPVDDERLSVLASHLTVGETYFFRDPDLFEALEAHVLPELIRARRGGDQRLRLWSAACCTGEEPYSLAILLHRLLPDLHEWRVTITATDINPRFLRKAAAGTYGPWSFRDVPDSIRQRYFTRTADGRFTIDPGIRKLVSFAALNLADDAYPSLTNGTHAMDLILCRNVLMYFSAPQAGKVIGKLQRALVPGGWLAVSPTETSRELFTRFAAVDVSGTVLYREGTCGVEHPASPPEIPLALPVAAGDALPEPVDRDAGDAAAAATPAHGRAQEPASFAQLARAHANRGDFAGALADCDRWLAADKLDPAAHYLRAVVLLEQGEATAARAALQRAIYLDPDFVLAHFALGVVARRIGNANEAKRHFGNALRLLRRHRPDDIVPDSDGIAAGRLADTIAAVTAGA